MKKEEINYPKEKVNELEDYFEGEERRLQKKNGENINWIEMSDKKKEEILSIKFEYQTIKKIAKQNNQKLNIV